MKLNKALQDAAKAQDAARMNRLFDQMESQGLDYMATPFICNVNLVGHKAHRFAWDCLEDWQDS